MNQNRKKKVVLQFSPQSNCQNICRWIYVYLITSEWLSGYESIMESWEKAGLEWNVNAKIKIPKQTFLRGEFCSHNASFLGIPFQLLSLSPFSFCNEFKKSVTKGGSSTFPPRSTPSKNNYYTQKEVTDIIFFSRKLAWFL